MFESEVTVALPYRGALFSFQLWLCGAAVGEMVVGLTPPPPPQLLGLGRNVMAVWDPAARGALSLAQRCSQSDDVEYDLERAKLCVVLQV